MQNKKFKESKLIYNQRCRTKFLVWENVGFSANVPDEEQSTLH